ncbi:MAG TPA: glucose-1-phosphate thymidylyltransferase [Chloroflexota bacterium]|nr:glucose-1-phosphate thymidylyltransferase [Chloroflexota bacterium]
MKGLVLSGGLGTRLRPLTYTGAKQLVPIANKPVLYYALEDLVEAGITEIGIVVGDTHAQIREAVGDGSQFGARVTYLEQDAPRGIAHGILIAREFLGDDPFVLFLGDNFLREGIVPFVEAFRRGDANAQILLYRVRTPQDFGVAELRDGAVVRVVEKPRDPPSDLAVIGIYMFDRHVHDIVANLQPSGRGELEITDTIQGLIDQGKRVVPQIVSGWWIDTGKKDDMLEANRLILETLDRDVAGTVDGDSQVHGKVIIAETASVHNSVIRGPAIIGPGTRLHDAYIGPFTSIDHDCLIEACEIEHSIVLDGSRLIDVPGRIEDSLIGRNVEIVRSPNKPKAYKLMLGDFSRVEVL